MKKELKAFQEKLKQPKRRAYQINFTASSPDRGPPI